MLAKPARDERRTEAQLRHHYEIERELAERLRRASKQERSQLYASLYDELFTRVPDHIQLARKESPQARQRGIASQVRLLRHLVNQDSCFLEIGAGDCALSFAIAKSVQRVYAVDVSKEIAKDLDFPANVQLILSDGCTIALPPESVDVAYSNQLMEHLHPDDAFEQLQHIYTVLKPGGVYLCVTPNQLSVPHDISRYFNTVAAGFHLKEYTTTELNNLFCEVGFSRVDVYVGTKGRFLHPPLWLIQWYEQILVAMPSALRKRAAYNLIRITGTK
jgi:SAM-dependent methyltransferase